jgi:CBS domain-containing protein
VRLPLAIRVLAHYVQGMRISEVIRGKDGPVVTVRPGDTVARVIELLEQRGIGALVVSEDGSAVGGIVSERDVVRHLHHEGGALLEHPVTSIMTASVYTCDPDDDVEQLARQMTERRIRHIPVVVDGRLRAMVSIGDIVKHRIDSLQAERDQLVGYIQQ